jgi:glycerol-3-phosphate cytidylyltransferase
MNEFTAPIVLTVGTFDTIHAGHIDLLERCAELGRVIVGLNSDSFIEQFKGKKPAYSYEERRRVLSACRYVSAVIPNEGNEDSKPLILKVQPRYLVIGSDWAKKDYYKQMQFTQDWLDQQGITLVYIPRIRQLSSTLIKERIKKC